MSQDRVLYTPPSATHNPHLLAFTDIGAAEIHENDGHKAPTPPPPPPPLENSPENAKRGARPRSRRTTAPVRPKSASNPTSKATHGTRIAGARPIENRASGVKGFTASMTKAIRGRPSTAPSKRPIFTPPPPPPLPTTQSSRGRPGSGGRRNATRKVQDQELPPSPPTLTIQEEERDQNHDLHRDQDIEQDDDPDDYVDNNMRSPTSQKRLLQSEVIAKVFSHIESFMEDKGISKLSEIFYLFDDTCDGLLVVADFRDVLVGIGLPLEDDDWEDFLRIANQKGNLGEVSALELESDILTWRHWSLSP